MSFEKELRLLSSGSFDDYLELVCQHLGFEGAAAVPDGVGDLSCEPGLVSYAVSRDDRFAAFRWLALAQKNPAIVESFMVSSATKGCRSALVRRLFPGSPEPESDTSANSFPLLEAWRRTVGGEPIAGEGVVPGFTELAVLLAVRGRVSVANAELLQKTRALESELEYTRIELAEVAEDLETAHANMRSTATAFKPESDLESLLRHNVGGEALSTDENDEDANVLESLPAWAADNAHRIVVLPRALSGAKKSQYQSPATIMKALELLAGPYRQHRCGELGLAEFDAALAAAGLQMAGSVGAEIAGTTGDQYFVQWGNRRRFLDMHLLKGGGREPRYCMRIYFFWDADSRRCVVGSLPAHLSNSLS